MKIKHAKLVNCFQHKNCEAEFSDFTSVTGANGTGKSNLIAGIRYALTGDMGLPGTKDTMISSGETKGHVELTITDEGEELLLKATAGKSNRSITRGEMKITTAKECMDYLKDVLLRTSPDIVNEASIIGQGKLDEGLFSPPAQRTAAFMRLAGLAEIETKREALAKELRRVSIPLYSLDLDTEEKKIQKLEAEKSDLETQLACPTQYGDSDRVLSAHQLLAKAEQAEEAKGQLGPFESQKTDLGQLKEEFTLELATLAAEHSELGGWVHDQTQAYKDALANQATREALLERVRQKESAEFKLQGATQAVNKLEVPVRKTDRPNLEDWRSAMADSRAALEMATKIKSSFSGSQRICPVFGTQCTTVDIETAIQKADKDISEIGPLLQEITSAVATEESERKEEEARVSQYERMKASMDSILAEAREAMKAFEGVEAPPPFEDYTGVISQYEAKQLKVKSIASAMNLKNDALKETTAALAGVEKSIASALAAVGGAQIDPIVLAETREFLSLSMEEGNARQQLTGNLQSVRKQLEASIIILNNLRTQAEEQKKMVEYTSAIEAARAALHRDNFPAGKVKLFILKLLQSVNQYLEVMQAGFSIEFDWEKGFEAKFPNKSMRADRLSGGERVIFALGFRFAVNEMSSMTGFMILDEPTVYLDAHHVDTVATALYLVKRRMKGRVQVIVVTHDERIASVADTIVRL